MSRCDITPDCAGIGCGMRSRCRARLDLLRSRKIFGHCSSSRALGRFRQIAACKHSVHTFASAGGHQPQPPAWLGISRGSSPSNASISAMLIPLTSALLAVTLMAISSSTPMLNFRRTPSPSMITSFYVKSGNQKLSIAPSKPDRGFSIGSTYIHPGASMLAQCRSARSAAGKDPIDDPARS